MTSLTLKPHLLRAGSTANAPLVTVDLIEQPDTIDLQNPQSPSAKDHNRGQFHGGYSHTGAPQTGTHHSQALRNANHDAYQEQHASPRLGGFDHKPSGPQHQPHAYDDDDDDDEDDDDGHPQNGMNGTSNGDHYDDRDGNDSQDDDMDDDMLDKMSSSPSIEDEDINFEFVYALHTFVATVEGQANATKGDTMVLLDDTNSYWWLVRVVKDGSIGYLPAEHIETPTERLARLNKHRNIDLSAAMLGDNPEKSKNPLKKAMRRRNAKTVNFAPPTYYEPSEPDWSDEEDVLEDDDGLAAHVENTASDRDQHGTEQDQRSQQSQHTRDLDHNDHAQHANQVNQVLDSQRVQPASATIHRVDSDNDTEDDYASSPVKNASVSNAPLRSSSEENAQRSRKGVVRNTDSFFRDDSVETKKISLTPHLLRGDSAVNANNEQEPKQRLSPDTFDRLVSEDEPKDGKKKEKKKGMLSGLFKRKDKSGKGGKHDNDEIDRLSEDSGRSPQSKESMDSDTGPDRKPSKLQKTNPTGSSPKQQSPTDTRAPVREVSSPTSATPTSPVSGHAQNITYGLVSAPQSLQHPAPDAGQIITKNNSPQDKRSMFAPLAGALKSKNSNQDVEETPMKPVYSKRAKERFAIDDSDSEDDRTPTVQSSAFRRSISPLGQTDLGEGRPDSEARISPLPSISAATSRTLPAEAKPIERSVIHQQVASAATPTSPSDQTVSTSKRSPSIPTHTPSTSRSTPTWSDASLRSYLDNDHDIRDLLVIVHDKTNVTPVSPDHPLMNGLFAPERTKLADMQTHLDSMLLSWLSKKTQPAVPKF